MRMNPPRGMGGMGPQVGISSVTQPYAVHATAVTGSCPVCSTHTDLILGVSVQELTPKFGYTSLRAVASNSSL